MANALRRELRIHGWWIGAACALTSTSHGSGRLSARVVRNENGSIAVTTLFGLWLLAIIGGQH